MRGKILARFLIVEKDKHKNEKIRQYSKKMNELYKRPENRANINICVIGIRKLLDITTKCKLTASLSDHIGRKDIATHNLKEGMQSLEKE